MLNVFGRNYEEIGSLDSGVILKGKIKIQWGKKFIDLLDSDGNLNVKIKSFIKSIKSKSEIKQDGFYFCDGQIFIKVGENILELTSESGNTYVSFIQEQETTEEQKYIALLNIGFIYKTENDSNVYPTNGIIYVEDDKSLYVVNNGKLEKYIAEFPVPFTKLFIIRKSDLSEGALIIEGEGSENGLFFDSMKIYSKNNYLFFEFDKGIIFLNGNKRTLELTPEGVKTDEILSFHASDERGYRIYYNEGKYILEIDKLHVREPDWGDVDSIKYLTPARFYVKENIILSTKREYYEDEPTQVKKYIFVLKYYDGYYYNEIFRVYIDNPEDKRIDTLEFRSAGSGYDLETEEFYVECLNPYLNILGGTLSHDINDINILNSYCCVININGGNLENELTVEGSSEINDYPENNTQLAIGKLGFSPTNSLDYNSYLFGVISKKNILYSAKFFKDPAINDYRAFPFYSYGLYKYIDDVNKYGQESLVEGEPTSWDYIVPPMGIVKKLIRAKSLSGLDSTLAYLNSDNPTPSENTYLHYINGHYRFDNYSLVLGLLLSKLNNPDYTDYPSDKGYLYYDNRNGTFKWKDITNTDLGLLGKLLTDLNDPDKTLLIPTGSGKFLCYENGLFLWKIPSFTPDGYQDLYDTVLNNNIANELVVSPTTISIKAGQVAAGVINVTCQTRWNVTSVTRGLSLSSYSGMGNGYFNLTSLKNTTDSNKNYTIVMLDMFYSNVPQEYKSLHQKVITVNLSARVSPLTYRGSASFSSSQDSVSITIHSSFPIVECLNNSEWITVTINSHDELNEDVYTTFAVLGNDTGYSRLNDIVLVAEDGLTITVNVTQEA